jgi:protein disulfide-isomerase-like protein
MKTFFIAILAPVVFLAALVQANFYDSPSSPVVPFRPAGKGQLRPQLTITEFYAPWCGHCQRLTPEYIKAAKRLSGAVRFTAINCDAAENKAVCGRYEIKGYPTLKIFDHGARSGPGEDYTGPREAKHIVRFLSERLKSLTAGKVRAVTNAKTFERFVVAPPELDPVSATGALKKRMVLLAGKKPQVPLLYRSLALEYSNFGVPAAGAGSKKNKRNKKAKRTPAASPTVEFVFVEPKLVARVAAHYNLTTESLVEGASTLLSIDAGGQATVFAGALKREPVVAYIEAYVNQKPAAAPEPDHDEL